MTLTGDFDITIIQLMNNNGQGWNFFRVNRPTYMIDVY